MNSAPEGFAITVDSAQKVAVMTPPDRLSVDTESPHYDPCYRRVEVWFDGERRSNDVQEYCVSEGWIRVRMKSAITGKWLLRPDGEFMTETLHGRVDPRFREAPRMRRTPYVPPEPDHEAHLSRAEEKRARKAAKLKRDWGGQ